MPNVEKISIALPPEMVEQVRQAVDSGEYASSSEVVRDALRDWTHKRQLRQSGLDDLRELWQQARRDKSRGKPVDKVLDDLERKYQAMVDAAGWCALSFLPLLRRTWRPSQIGLLRTIHGERHIHPRNS